MATQWRDKSRDFMTPRRINDGDLPRVVISAARIRIALGHRWNSYAEGFVDATKHTMIRTLLYDYDVIVDGTHTTKASIQRMFEIDPEAEFVFVDTPPSICMDRASRNGRDDLIPIIDRMADQILSLTKSDHWDFVGDRIDSSVNAIRLLAWDQFIED